MNQSLNETEQGESEEEHNNIEYIIDIVVVLTIGYLFYASIGFIQVFLKNGRSSSILHIPMWLQYGIAPVSYCISIISYFYAKYFDKSRKKEEE